MKVKVRLDNSITIKYEAREYDQLENNRMTEPTVSEDQLTPMCKQSAGNN